VGTKTNKECILPTAPFQMSSCLVVFPTSTWLFEQKSNAKSKQTTWINNRSGSVWWVYTVRVCQIQLCNSSFKHL